MRAVMIEYSLFLFKWCHFKAEATLLCAVVAALFAELLRHGGNDARAETAHQAYHYLSVILLLPNWKNIAILIT